MSTSKYNVNQMINTIETDQALFDILSNFSDDYIDNMVKASLDPKIKFRPFNNRLPDVPKALNLKFQSVKDHYTGDSVDLIDQKMYDSYMRIIQIICEFYNLSLNIDAITKENLYPFTYYMYQIFVTEFTNRMLDMYTTYIIENSTSIIANIPEDKRTIRSNYIKKIFDDKTKMNYMIIYENMNIVINILASLDIPFYQLLVRLSDEQSADFLSIFVNDNGDCYKYYFAPYLYSEDTKASMISILQLRIIDEALDHPGSIFNPENNPYLEAN